MILNTLNSLFADYRLIEIRCMKDRPNGTGKIVHSGVFESSQFELAAKEAERLNRDGYQVYILLNEIDASTLSADFRFNAMKAGTKAISDENIGQRRKMLIDLDPIRPAGTSSTEEQLEATRGVAQQVIQDLLEAGWPQPTVAESGNGIHLLFNLDLPAQDEGLVRGALEALKDKYLNKIANVDTTVHNASRICKLYGAISQKGEERRISFIDVDGEKDIVTADQLKALVPEKKVVEMKKASKYASFDLQSFIERAGLDVYRTETNEKGSKYLLRHCLFDHTHVGGSAAILQVANGGFAYKCQHDSCRENGWKEAREMVDGSFTDKVFKDFEVEEADEPVQPKLPALHTLTMTDEGAALRLVAQAAGRLKFVAGLNKEGAWLSFDPINGWVEHAGFVNDLHREASDRVLDQVREQNDSDLTKAALRWFNRLKSSDGTAAAIKVAKTLREVRSHIGEFDTDPLLLGFLNGFVDLRTGEFKRYTQDTLIYRRCAVEYNPDAEAPTVWLKFLNEIFPSDPEGMTRFMQEFLGYAVTGLTDENKLAIMHGKGANGKSVLVNAIFEMLGTYAGTAPQTLFLEAGRPSSGPTPELAALAGVRFVICSETDDGMALKAALVKSITSGDNITARHLHSEPFTFRPQLQAIIATNHLPRISSTDHGVWRRMMPVPFERKFEVHEQDRSLERRIKEEAPAIMKWIVEGSVRYLKERALRMPKRIEDAITTYRSDQDIVQKWLDDRCIAEADAKVQSSEAYGDYKRWAAEMGYKALSNKSLTEILKDKGFETKKSGNSLFVGFRLINQFGM